MIRIGISPAAYAAIASTLPGSVGVEPGRAPNGDYFVWLDPAVVNRLAAMPGPAKATATSSCDWQKTDPGPLFLLGSFHWRTGLGE
jgi:hypothetical protein